MGCHDGTLRRRGPVYLGQPYYAEKIKRLTKIDGGRIQVIPLGIDLTDCTPAPEWPDPPVIGFLSRLSPALGLGVLVEAFLRLKQSPRWQRLRLRATGGQTGDDAAFIAQLRQRLAAAGCAESVEFLPEFDRPKRLEFLRSLSVLSVPVPAGEALGATCWKPMRRGCRWFSRI